MVYLFNVIELFGVNKMGAAGPRLGALRPKLGPLVSRPVRWYPPLLKTFLEKKVIFRVVFLGGSSHSDPIEPPLKKYLFTSVTRGGYFEALSRA